MHLFIFYSKNAKHSLLSLKIIHLLNDGRKMKGNLNTSSEKLAILRTEVCVSQLSITKTNTLRQSAYKRFIVAHSFEVVQEQWALCFWCVRRHYMMGVPGRTRLCTLVWSRKRKCDVDLEAHYSTQGSDCNALKTFHEAPSTSSCAAMRDELLTHGSSGYI